MTVIKCHVCGADPCARRTSPPAMIFIDNHRSDGGSKYRCREHVSPTKEAELQTRERGWPKGGLR